MAVCGAKGNSSDAAVLSAKRTAPGAPSPRLAGVLSLSSSITAAIAVLNAKRSLMSAVTLSIAQCALRSSRWSSAPRSSGTGWSGSSSAASAHVRHSRPEEAVHALDPGVGPVGVLVGRADEQDVAARGVGPEAVDERPGVDDVALRLGHLRAVLGDHPLREEPRERLLDVGQMAEVG